MRISMAVLDPVATICPAKVADRSAWSAATWQATSDAVALPGDPVVTGEWDGPAAGAGADEAHSTPAARSREIPGRGESDIANR